MHAPRHIRRINKKRKYFLKNRKQRKKSPKHTHGLANGEQKDKHETWCFQKFHIYASSSFAKWWNKEMKNAMHFTTFGTVLPWKKHYKTHTHILIYQSVDDWLMKSLAATLLMALKQEIHTKNAVKIKSPNAPTTQALRSFLCFLWVRKFTMKDQTELNHINSWKSLK